VFVPNEAGDSNSPLRPDGLDNLTRPVGSRLPCTRGEGRLSDSKKVEPKKLPKGGENRA